ncbi:1-phosphofructokinase family hexose kinase [Anaerococcus sp. AGMB00486]|uniref:Tagatose-6-phosphate kinase n=2 Tax=Anaerococcus TaxID=165779 RepID=A0ABX2NAS9_9FIRM|nr:MULTISPECIES: 1-phosphofructokinase family hexose kinase [Anaerococcus]MDY3006910.1 1-phosphofructokinase family hexose kinase [Anaerococcus porci]MSS78518.1 1-phosphofructokinase family hexose kinase [Anaerococcus porci]NVF11758.1 1-phosphofructokinase family hexose kinase [Anaerococcus faecalis]
MIYTVTLNPSVDVFLEVENFNFGDKNHVSNEFTLPGGKAINVSRVLNQLNIPTIATGFIGGHQGAFIEEWLEKDKIMTDFVEIKGSNRTNIKLLLDKNETTINSKGPYISHEEINELLYYLSRVGEGDTIIMGGSVPPLKDKLDNDIYSRMVSIAKANRANFIADIPAEYLKDVIKEKPILVKPNSDDLSIIFDVKIESLEDIDKYGKKIIEMGAQNAIVSYGKKGSMFFTRDGHSYVAEEIEIKNLVNSVSCRDAMIGGFIGTFVRTSDPLEAYKVAVAAATATAEVLDLPSREEIEEKIKKVVINQFS